MPSGQSEPKEFAIAHDSQSWGRRGTVGPVFAGQIETLDLSFEINSKPLLKNINIELKAGEITCLLGPSGCGKSTLLRILAGLVPQTTGTIKMDGVDIASDQAFLPPERRSIGLMFQDFALFPHLTVLQNVMFGLYALSHNEAVRTADQALARVGMLQFRDTYPAMLSGGEQQRVALARTIVPRPQVVLMDEPFSGLDQRLRQSVRAETVAVLREMRATALLVTHDPEEALEIADHIILMRAGRIVQAGDPYAVHDHPANLDAARFFLAADEIVATVQNGQLKTALGTIQTPKLRDGTSVTIVLRPGAIVQSDASTAVEGHVVTVQRQGRTLVCKIITESANTLFSVHIEKLDTVKVGDVLSFALSPDQILAFETETGVPI
jgi:iron(III) transport system ATP-binding protein